MLPADGYTDLPPGKLANVVTCLEMRERPEPRASSPALPCAVRRAQRPEPQWYRALFRRIGEPYLWSSRLSMSDAQLRDIIHDPAVEVYALECDGEDCGLAELDFRVPGECELSFFGLTADRVGRGLGRGFMTHTIERAWSHPIHRFWVHTCTLDHPGAVPFYVRSGFVPYKRQIEILDDPRSTGILSKSAAPGVPLL